MNEVNIQKFLEQTEQYLRSNRQDLSQQELDNAIKLVEDLNNEYDRQQLLYDLYH